MSTEAPAAATESTENEAPEASYAETRNERMQERFGKSEPAVNDEPDNADESTDDRSATQPVQKPAAPVARKPYQHAVPPDRVEALLRQRDERITALETEIRLASEGRLTPAQVRNEAEQRVDSPVRPKPADFQKPDGSFDEDGYIDALTDYSTQKALAKFNETQQTRQQQELEQRQREEVQRTGAELSRGFHEQATELYADPEIGQDVQAAIAHITSNEVATHIPLPIQHEIMRAGPGVAYLLSQDQRLIDVLQSGDIITATKLIASAEQYLAQRVGQAQGQPAPRQQAPTRAHADDSNAMGAPRQNNGQYAPRRQPTGPVDIEGTSAAGAGSSYEAHRERRLKERGLA